jgi:protein O-GlcNAc transferase
VKPSNGILARKIDAVLAQKPPAGNFWEQPQPQPARPQLALSREQAAAAKLMDEAMVLLKFRQFPAAVGPIQQASKLWPTNAEIRFHLGGVFLECGRPDLALKEFDIALGIKPNWSDCWNNKSASLARMGLVEEAIAAAERAAELAPNVSALANLCAAYSGMGRNDRALEAGERAIQLSQGTNPMALINYGVALRAVWRLDEAAGAQERAIEVAQKQGARDHMAFSNLGAIRNLQGRNHDALAVTQIAAELAPTTSTVRSNMIMFADLLPETTLREAYAMRRTWAHLFEAPLKRKWRPHQNDRTPDRRLRVGYVGADFRQHSAAHIHGAIIRAHDPSQVAVYVYAGNATEDEVSAKIREAPALAEWVQTSRMDDGTLAERVWSDQIDILVDCAGFTAGGRLGTFAHKPAPIQCSAWGYANSVGLDAMTAFIADNVIVPPELEYGYHEPVIRMSSLLTFDPFMEIPPPKPPPMLKNGYVTYGSLNRVEKISRPILELWCRVMREVPDSRILLKFGGLDAGETAEQLKQGFEQFGVSRDRVETRGHTSRAEHIGVYDEIDMSLDTWPHVGGITTLEGAMSGVPCVTLLGERAPSRVSASILHSIGLDDWIAATPDDYVRIAVEKSALDLSELRQALPGLIRGTTVGDPERYTRELEQVYRDLWRGWCLHAAPAVDAL